MTSVNWGGAGNISQSTQPSAPFGSSSARFTFVEPNSFSALSSNQYQSQQQNLYSLYASPNDFGPYVPIRDKLKRLRQMHDISNPVANANVRAIISQKYGVSQPRKKRTARQTGRNPSGHITHGQTIVNQVIVPSRIRNNPNVRHPQEQLQQIPNPLQTDSYISPYNPKYAQMSAVSLADRGFIKSNEDVTATLGLDKAPALLTSQAQSHTKREIYCVIQAPDGAKIIRPKRAVNQTTQRQPMVVLDLITPIEGDKPKLNALPDHSYKQRVTLAMVKHAEVVRKQQTLKQETEVGQQQQQGYNTGVRGIQQFIQGQSGGWNANDAVSNTQKQEQEQQEQLFQQQQQQLQQQMQQQQLEQQQQQSPEPTLARNYTELLDAFSLHHIIIKRYKTVTSTPEFESYARAFRKEWVRITAALVQMEDWCEDNAVDLAFFDGKKVAEIALDDDFVLDTIQGNQVNALQANNTQNQGFNNQQSGSQFSRLSYGVIMDCIVNIDDVRAILKRPGQKYKGKDKERKAAITIQSQIRMFVQRSKYNRISRKGLAATKIQRRFRAFQIRLAFLAKMEQVLRSREEQFDFLQEQLYAEWSDIKRRKHVHIHLPSIGWDERIRKSVDTRTHVSFPLTNDPNQLKITAKKKDGSQTNTSSNSSPYGALNILEITQGSQQSQQQSNQQQQQQQQNYNQAPDSLLFQLFPSLQNGEFSRLLDLKDPLVDVILISPLPLPNEVLSYIKKLLSAVPAVSVTTTVNVLQGQKGEQDTELTASSAYTAISAVSNVESRLRVIVPENASIFPSYLPLSLQVLLSPQCIKKIRGYTVGQRSIIYGGCLGKYDQALSVQLNTPIFSPLPAIAQAFGTKSGAKRIFASADVNTFPSIYDIYDPALIPAAISRLVSRAPTTTRVLLKIDDEVEGRGHLLCRVKEFIKSALNELEMGMEDVLLSPAVVALAALEEREEEEEKEEMEKAKKNGEQIEDEKKVFPSTHRQFVQKIKENQVLLEETLAPKIAEALGIDAIQDLQAELLTEEEEEKERLIQDRAQKKAKHIANLPEKYRIQPQTPKDQTPTQQQQQLQQTPSNKTKQEQQQDGQDKDKDKDKDKEKDQQSPPILSLNQLIQILPPFPPCLMFGYASSVNMASATVPSAATQTEKIKAQQQAQQQGQDDPNQTTGLISSSLYAQQNIQFPLHVLTPVQKQQYQQLQSVVTSNKLYPISTSPYPNWPSFVYGLSQQGGLVELCPESKKIVGHPVVEVNLEPDGKQEVTFIGEKLFPKKKQKISKDKLNALLQASDFNKSKIQTYEKEKGKTGLSKVQEVQTQQEGNEEEEDLSEFISVGITVPQRAVPTVALRDATLAIGRACIQKRMLGRIHVNYVVFYDEWDALRMCAVDLNPYPSRSAAGLRWAEYLMLGGLDMERGKFYARHNHFIQHTIIRQLYAPQKNTKVSPKQSSDTLKQQDIKIGTDQLLGSNVLISTNFFQTQVQISSKDNLVDALKASVYNPVLPPSVEGSNQSQGQRSVFSGTFTDNFLTQIVINSLPNTSQIHQIQLQGAQNTLANPSGLQAPQTTPIPCSIIVLNQTYQPELKVVPHSQFFSACREQGFSFDFDQKRGVLFLMPAHLINGIIQLISIDHTMIGAAEMGLRCLETVSSKILHSTFTSTASVSIANQAALASLGQLIQQSEEQKSSKGGKNAGKGSQVKTIGSANLKGGNAGLFGMGRGKGLGGLIGQNSAESEDARVKKKNQPPPVLIGKRIIQYGEMEAAVTALRSILDILQNEDQNESQQKKKQEPSKQQNTTE